MLSLIVLSIVFKLVSAGGDTFDPASSVNQFIARKMDPNSESSVNDEAFSQKIVNEASIDSKSNAFLINDAGKSTEIAALEPSSEASERKIKKRKTFVMKTST